MNKVRKILVVDDDPVERNNVEQALTGKGYAVVGSSNGEDALWQLDNDNTYDAVFTDIRLRGMSGLEVAEEIHARHRGFPVVIFGGDESDAARKRAEAAGVTEFLRQPLSPEQLANIALRLLPATESETISPSRYTAAAAVPAQATNKVVMRLKNIILFLLAPFFALGYGLVFPIVGLGMLAWWAFNPKEQLPEEAEHAQHLGAARQPGVLKTLAELLGTVVVGVAFAVFGPILGIGLVLSFGFQAWGRLGAKAIGSSEP